MFLCVKQVKYSPQKIISENSQKINRQQPGYPSKAVQFRNAIKMSGQNL